MKIYPILFLALVLSASSCKKGSAPLDKPEVAFVSMTPNIVKSGLPKDTVLISLRYTIAVDGIGQGTDPTDVLLIDSREPTAEIRLRFPDDVANNIPEGKNNISGSITLKLAAAEYLVLRPDRPDGDTLTYTLCIEDKHGVRSEKVETPNLFIMP